MNNCYNISCDRCWLRLYNDECHFNLSVLLREVLRYAKAKQIQFHILCKSFIESAEKQVPISPIIEVKLEDVVSTCIINTVKTL